MLASNKSSRPESTCFQRIGSVISRVKRERTALCDMKPPSEEPCSTQFKSVIVEFPAKKNYTFGRQPLYQ
jgi:hypothetical protein